MSFTIWENVVYMCTGESVLIHDLTTRTTITISLPKLTIDANQKHHNNADLDAYHGITAIFTSRDGRYFCVCTNRKQLCLYDRASQSLISNRTLPRAASRARFTPDNNIIVADKSGDLYLYETQKRDLPGHLLLGHLSMLLDCLVTDDNAYVITADRDEKIRVSRYPNAYNVESYCLGHEKFVTAVAQSPNHPEILLSAGGDGCVKFWDYVAGKELESFSYAEEIPTDELSALNDSLKCFELTERVETLPVKHLKLIVVNVEKTLLVITFYSSSRVVVYSLSEKHELRRFETLTMDEEPLEFHWRKPELWILDDRGFTVYNVWGDRLEVDETRNASLTDLNENWRSLRKNANRQSLFPILYKRKFDNVQEYRERKKSRLGN